MISAYMKDGNIIDHLKQDRRCDRRGLVSASSIQNFFTQMLIYEKLTQAAEGLHYLHSLNHPLLHGDLKGVILPAARPATPNLVYFQANLLIDYYHRVRLCDFGMTRPVIEEESQAFSRSSGLAGSFRWMAPELVIPLNNQDPTKSIQTDVYAFGMTMYEVKRCNHLYESSHNVEIIRC